MPSASWHSRLPELVCETNSKQAFKVCPIGYLHIDIAEVRTEEAKLFLFVAIHLTSKFAFTQLHAQADRPTAVAFLESLLASVPYRLHTILTDNGIQFCDLPRNRDSWTSRYRVLRFNQICHERGIEHRLTKPNHPWTNGQVERMNRTIKEATVKRYHNQTEAQLRQHLQLFMDAYNYGRRLKTLFGLTPYEYIARVWTETQERFKLNPCHLSAGLNT